VKALADKDAIKSLLKPLSRQEDGEPSLGAPPVPVGRLESHGALCASPRSNVASARPRSRGA
jgi:hypothetical protein